MEELRNDSINQPDTTSSHAFELIRFDKKVNTYIGICIFFFLIFVMLKLHNSSISSWNANMNDGAGEKRGLVAGRPLAVRSDEWLVISSFVVAQENDTLPVSNEALGYGKTPLLIGLPTNSILSKIRPALWGYYFLDKERGFSWQWNFKVFPFLIVSFLFLMLFTRNNFKVSIFGSIWLFLSSAIQWWSINTEIFTFGFLSIISLIYIIYSNRPKLILLNGIIFLLASYSFITILYPAYQVPFGYFLLVLLFGYLINNGNLKIALTKKQIRFPVLTLSTIVLLSLVYFFLKECRETIRVVSNTVYPGQRIATGGGFSFISLFRDNYSWFLGANYFPPNWGNICEISSFLMLSPVATVMIVYSFLKTRKINNLLIPLVIFQLIVFIWLLWGFPEFLARFTLFSLSPTPRTFFIFGFSNVVLTLLYLGQFKGAVPEKPSSWHNKTIVFFAIFVMIFFINYGLNKQSEHFFSISQIFNAAILFSVLNWLVVYFKQQKIYQTLFFISCLFFISANIFINPLSKGLSPYFENKIFETASKIENKDPGNGWVVFGHMTAPDFLKAAGANCFNGVQFVPPVEKLHILDPSSRNNDVYNRYAHIVFYPLIDGRDSVRFTLNQADLYTIQMDPCSPRLKQIGIKYFMFGYKPPAPEVRCLVPVADTMGFYIYKRNDL